MTGTDLFSPVRIGDVELRNRTVLPPMTTRLADDDGFVTDRTLAYYRARAEGGVGLVTVEMATPERAGKHRFRELGLCEQRFEPGLRRLVETIHAAGARASIQLGHAGSRSRSAVSGETPVAPSAIPTPVFEIEQETVVPEAMTAERIERTTASYVVAAARAQRVGFDVVELHGAHGYLISQFLSPAENHRTDRWGGSPENRARFGLDILRRIKAEVPGLPVIFRIGVEDFFPGGLSADDGVRVGVWAAEAGADAVSVTAGHYRSLPNAERMIPPMRYEPGAFLAYARRVRDAVAVPVIGVGRLGDPDLARRAVAEGAVDLVALGRPLLADPDWPRKVEQDAPVRRCLSCNHCVNSMRSGDPISCVVNPVAARETVFAGTRPAMGRRIRVLGAGPAGLTYAALVGPGNDVAVIETAGAAGGAFRWTGRAPRFNDVVAEPGAFADYVADQVRTCRRAGVAFHHRATAESTRALLADADVVVVATGARYPTGLAGPVRALLRSGLARSAPGRRLFARPGFRDWLYHRFRRPTGEAVRLALAPDLPAGAEVVVIGDARRAGKARQAITDAAETALLHQAAAAPAPGGHHDDAPQPEPHHHDEVAAP